jgi:hypothetical protein
MPIFTGSAEAGALEKPAAPTTASAAANFFIPNLRLSQSRASRDAVSTG